MNNTSSFDGLSREQLIAEIHRLGAVAREREDELNMIFRISAVLDQEDFDMDRLCKGIAVAMAGPSPGTITKHLRVNIGPEVYESSGFMETPTRLKVPLAYTGDPEGSIELFFEFSDPQMNTTEYLHHEVVLLHVLARGIARFLVRARYVETIRQNQRMLRQIIDTLPQSVFWKDTEGKYLGCNQPFAEAAGLNDPERIIGKTDFDLPWLWEESEAYRADDAEVLRTGKAKMHIVETIQQADGIKRWIDTSKVLLVDDQRGLMGVLGIYEDITGQKHAESLLAESKSLVSTIINSTNDMIWAVDAETMAILTYNNTFADYIRKHLGVDLHPGMHLEEITTDPGLLQMWRNWYQKTLEAGTWLAERITDGNALVLELTFNLLKNEDKVFGISVFGRDITGMKKAEHNARERMKELQAFYVLSELITTPGITEDGICRRFVEFLPASWQYPENCCVRLYLREEVFCSTNFRESPWMMSAPILAGEKQLGTIQVGYLAERPPLDEGPFMKEERMVLNTLAVRFGQFLEQRQAERWLKETQNQYIQLLQTTDQGIYGINIEGLCTFINRAALKILGYTEEECIGREMHTLIHHHFTDGQEYPAEQCPIYHTMRNGTGCSMASEVMWRKDGTSFPVEYSSYPIIEQGLIRGSVITFSDITDRRLAEEELRTAKEKAVESDRLKTAFLQNLSHEIRTPMNSIQGFSQLMSEPDLSREEQQQYAGLIKKGCDRMVNIINDLVDVSKIEAGIREINPVRAKVIEVLSFLYDFFRPGAEMKGLKFEVFNDLPDLELIITTDRDKWIAVFSNLLKNAIKYTSVGSVQFGCKVEDHNLLCQVTDTGIGIPHARHKAVFERFIQADIEDKQAFQGIGLGLSIARSYVEMLGGKIWLESEAGQGATFFFTLPLSGFQAVSSNSNVPTEQKSFATGKKSFTAEKLLKILIVDDDIDALWLVNRIVRKISRETLQAESGSEALNIFKQHPDTDLVLMDIRIPEMDGLEVTRQIRQMNSKVIIIAQTAHAIKGDRESALEAGCDDYIPKPLDPGKLRELVLQYFKH